MEEKDMFEQFWKTYPIDLCSRRGSKPKAKKIFDSIDEEMKKQIIVNMRELMRVDRAVKKAGDFVSRWPMVTTWLNGERWEDICDIKQSHQMPVDRRKCSCGADTEIVDKCWACHDLVDPAVAKRKQILKDKFIENGLFHDESKEDRTKRCREFAVPKMARLLAQKEMRKIA